MKAIIKKIGTIIIFTTPMTLAISCGNTQKHESVKRETTVSINNVSISGLGNALEVDVRIDPSIVSEGPASSNPKTYYLLTSSQAMEVAKDIFRKYSENKTIPIKIKVNGGAMGLDIISYLGANVTISSIHNLISYEDNISNSLDIRYAQFLK